MREACIFRERNSLYQTLCMHMRDICRESYGPKHSHTHTHTHTHTQTMTAHQMLYLKFHSNPLLVPLVSTLAEHLYAETQVIMFLYFRGCFLQASMEGPADVSSLERCPHVGRCCVQASLELGSEHLMCLY